MNLAHLPSHAAIVKSLSAQVRLSLSLARALSLSLSLSLCVCVCVCVCLWDGAKLRLIWSEQVGLELYDHAKDNGTGAEPEPV